jgi:hypothetical protein
MSPPSSAGFPGQQDFRSALETAIRRQAKTRHPIGAASAGHVVKCRLNVKPAEMA